MMIADCGHTDCGSETRNPKSEIGTPDIYIKEILEKGIIKGKEEGKIDRIEKDILFILTKRFKTVPKIISNNIKEIKDLESLEALLEAAITVSDIAEFEKHISEIAK
ncbi:MAG TPA: hypothetical protein EYP22_08130 [Methanosarcinales archaeon]|nr:hypothetical protein [Methanosarcinales archaeon]